MGQSRLSLPRLAALGIPLVLGLVGFLSAGDSILNALFSSICMYALNYQDAPPNLWVEIGRWTAPLATASGILLAVAVLRDRVRAFFCYRRGDSVAVYGPEREKALLLAQLGRRGIDGKERFVRAQRYILLDGEGENFGFYARSRAALAGSQVCLKCSSLPAQSVSAPGLRLFCPEETAARLFWKRRSLYELSVRRGHRLKIVFLGFGKLGEELLTCALQDNIFSPDQSIEYHIFGDGEAFSSIHTQLGEIDDPVLFHGEPWYARLPLLEEADMVAVLEQEEQLPLLQGLLLATCRARIDVFAAEEAGTELLAGRDRLAVFDWRQEAQSLEHILSDTLFRRAKRINLRYAHLYGGVPENEQAREDQWQLLDAFTRYSNISAADYHEVRLVMLAALGEPTDGSPLSPECLERMAELEHIRWCRYHHLNNWRYGVPENGKRKDPALRIHADLIPYRDLTDEEKEKDRENIRILLAIP